MFVIMAREKYAYLRMYLMEKVGHIEHVILGWPMELIRRSLEDVKASPLLALFLISSWL